MRFAKMSLATAAISATAALGGCAHSPFEAAYLDDHECMARVMYFESNRSSPDGMLAVGTTVMNRLADPRYPKTVCGVVGQSNQFADGVLSKPMNRRERRLADTMADRVLGGERHGQVGGAMFFHTAGFTFPYTNMHYVAVAGGNAFYEKRPAGSFVNSSYAQFMPREDTPSEPTPPSSYAAPRRYAATRSYDGRARPTTLAAEINKALPQGHPTTLAAEVKKAVPRTIRDLL